MQDQYVGDIGDFLKLLLFKELGVGSEYKLGINWYYVSPEQRTDVLKENNGDGKHRALRNKLAAINQALGKIFHEEIEAKGHRSIGLLSNALTEFLDSPTLEYAQAVAPWANRAEWFGASAKALDSTSLVFLDPDNGIEIRSMAKPKALKYCLYEEILGYYRTGKDVLVYQHRSRQPLEKQLSQIDARLVERGFVNTGQIKHIVSPYWSNVVFICLFHNTQRLDGLNKEHFILV